METVTKDGAPSANESWKMFDRIAHRYDLLNRLLSCGQDVVWRKKIAKHLPEKIENHLDLATGTGDQIFHLWKVHGNIQHATGIDLSEGMLEHGRPKIAKRGLNDKVSLQKGDAANIPFEDGRFDSTTISFGIRNVVDVRKSLGEMLRVLKPAGRSIILEFSLPKNPVIKKLYLIYFRKILPFIGGKISGDSYAYNYLNKTVETFPYGDEFCQLMRDAGFQDVKAKQLTFGIATIYQGDKAPHE